MNGALLSEVWPDMVVKPKKEKKKKKKNMDLFHPPLSPNEMDKELLDDDDSNDDIKRKIAGMKMSPYTDEELKYQNINRKRRYEYEDRRDYEDDPDYKEFMEYKQMKELKRKSEEEYMKKESTPQEQFNELLLYIFTGFFLLMIYDNIYKLGRNEY